MLVVSYSAISAYVLISFLIITNIFVESLYAFDICYGDISPLRIGLMFTVLLTTIHLIIYFSEIGYTVNKLTTILSYFIGPLICTLLLQNTKKANVFYCNRYAVDIILLISYIVINLSIAVYCIKPYIFHRMQPYLSLV